MRKIGVAVAAALVTTTFLAPAANADPAGCSSAFVQLDNTKWAGYGRSECNSGIQRLKLTCYVAANGQIYTVNGPWASPNVASNAQCAQPDYAIGATASRS
ncbi:hypothetical protein ABZ345_42405 [Lentzea sp. NPDC005914]|uniref:hypothetical protein n=1 Tax=Lentzea sp. NPDC005914 TaxID=3154572 RepID=UPI0033D5B183